MSHSLRFTLIVASMWLGCASKSDVVPATPVVEDRVGAMPVTVSWTEVERGSDFAVLKLTVQKQVKVETDVTVELTVPRGVTAEPEALAWRISAAEVGVLVRDVRVRWNSPPTEDLLAVADSQGQASGFRITAPYAFGRKPAEEKQPVTGNPVQLGNHALGRPVDLTSP